MKQAIAGAVLAAALAIATAADGPQTFAFDGDAPGAVPAGWRCGVTGRGQPHWSVQADSLRAGGRVLLQDGAGTFPWCVRPDAAIADGFVQARFVALAGREDQAGGVVWRWKDGDTYYVARANALENNVGLYVTENGVRRTLKSAAAPVARGVPHVLGVEFSGERIVVTFDGRRAIEVRDRHIAGAGAVGVWTKADSVTAFREFGFGDTAR